MCSSDLYRPLARPEGAGWQYAATEPGLIPGRRRQGEVHDENAWAAGKVAGHAGLFGAVGDVFRLAAALYRAYAGEPQGPGQPFASALTRQFLKPLIPGGRALGFDTPAADSTQRAAGRGFSPNSVGHLGFTGVSFWLDLDTGQMVILLTNRVHLGREDRQPIQAFRPRFHEAASRALGLAV